MKIVRPAFASILALGAAIILSACQTTTPESVKPHISIIEPSAGVGSKPYPVVFFVQGTGGGNHRANLWGQRFAQEGIASVAIDNAGLRGRPNLYGIEPWDMASDYAAALRLLEKDPRFDMKRHALMGFSRGGTAAMLSGTALAADQPKPRTVIAFYPGNLGDCSENLPAETSVHVFYGELDEWGSHRGTRDACRRMAEGKPGRTFHLVKNAHHAFDDRFTLTWPSDNRSFRSEPNPEARAEVERTLVQVLKAALN